MVRIGDGYNRTKKGRDFLPILMPSKQLDFYHKKEDVVPLNLTKEEEYDLHQDFEDIRNQREYRDKQAQKWHWAGSVYNVLQNATANDRISNITLGWIRSYIDTGIAQMTAGEPEFDYDALGPSDEARTMLWKSLVKTAMNRSNFMSHQNIAMTDAHIFGPGVFEVFQQRPYRTIREPQNDGTFKERVIIDHRIPRVGARAVSPFRVTRNPNVSDPNEVGSCTKEEILTWNQFVAKYGRCDDVDGKPKYKHIDEINKGSHVKVTIYQDEIRDVYRIYALSYGSKSDGEAETPPEQLGVPIFDRPLKIHDIYDKRGILERSMGLNLPGMCNLVFLPYADKLTDNFEDHCIYGMGLPEHMEGLDMFMQTAFNMTIDNWRMGNTVVLDIESRDGTIPDFDANQYYGGEFINAKVVPQTLGQDRTVNFDNMYEIIQKLAIPGTGININQIAGDTSKTAFEFAQRIEANNKRSEMRLKEWEAGPLKRLGTLLLSACISELTVHDLENIREGDAESILKEIEKGRATRDDFEFEAGKPVKRKVRTYIDMKGWKESFTKKTRPSRKLNADSVDSTLIKDTKNPEAVSKIPVTEEYVFPDWYAESGVLFDTKVDSKRMITNKKIRDAQALQALIQNILQVAQLDPKALQAIDFSKLIEQSMKLAELDTEDIMKKTGQDELSQLMEQVAQHKQQLEAIASNPSANAQVPQPVMGGQQVNPQQPQSLGGGLAAPQNPLNQAAQGAL